MIHNHEVLSSSLRLATKRGHSSNCDLFLCLWPCPDDSQGRRKLKSAIFLLEKRNFALFVVWGIGVPKADLFV